MGPLPVISSPPPSAVEEREAVWGGMKAGTGMGGGERPVVVEDDGLKEWVKRVS